MYKHYLNVVDEVSTQLNMVDNVFTIFTLLT